jgi:hypothetical protein
MVYDPLQAFLEKSKIQKNEGVKTARKKER